MYYPIKNIFLGVGILLLAGSTVMAQYEPPKNETKSFPWPKGKRCAVSLTFDDARQSQIKVGIDLLNAYDVKATFYVTPSNVKDHIKQWRSAVNDGHEIGNHTVSHPCTGNYAFSRDNALENYTIDGITQQMEKANEYILNTLNVKVKSFAYPCGQKFVGRGENLKSYVPIVARKFLTGRGWLDEGSNDPWFCDMAQLLGMESDNKSFKELKQLIDQAANERRWLILAGHEIGKEGNQTTLISSLEKLCEYAKEPENGIWIDTVATIAEYINLVRE